MKRYVLLVLGTFVLFSVATDPYTLHKTAGDYVEWGPWWQMSLGIIDLIILGVLIWILWRHALRRGAQLLVAETIYNLVVTIVLVQRDGVARFIQGLGAEEYLSLYLVAVAARVLLLSLISNPEASAEAATRLTTSSDS